MEGPLEGNQVQHRISLPLVRFNRRKENSKLKGPLKVIRLCVLGIILPGLLIAGPLYLRYRVYSEQVYPLGMSDMRLVDNKISTTWCERQLVKSNATFSAYLLSEQPKIKPDPTHVSMVRHLDLDDDMKEYWGFYLLKGSSVTISTCCRWPGASLIVIRGHGHLRECAYIGDNSSEEEDEIEEFNRAREELEKDEKDKTTNRNPDEDEGISNEPWMMKRARPSVVFHGSQQDENTSKHRLSKEKDSDTDNDIYISHFPIRKNRLDVEKSRRRKINSQTEGYDNKSNYNKSPSREKTLHESSHTLTVNITNVEGNNDNVEMVTKGKDETIYEDVLEKILSLGNRGKEILKKLHQNLENNSDFKNSRENDSLDKNNEIENDRNDKKPVKKREITLSSLQEDLVRNDEESNMAEEEGKLNQEDIRGSINGTTLRDMSNSEFWSSFSSSEERLLSCAGLILNLPLTPHKGCDPNKSEESRAKASLTNKLTYKVPSNGYYFFVFSSENEIQPNYIRVHFHLEKILYNVSNPVASCTNTTDSCSLPLNFFSKEKVVLELPVNANDTLWNQEYFVVSTCEPRTIVYAACVIAVPILILLFAF